MVFGTGHKGTDRQRKTGAFSLYERGAAMTASMPALMSFGRRLSMLADEHPDQPAIIFVPHEGNERRVSWRELDHASNRLARLLEAQGVDEHSTVVVGLPNGPEHYIATFATWKMGALPLALRSTMPDRER